MEIGKSIKDMENYYSKCGLNLLCTTRNIKKRADSTKYERINNK